MERRVHVQGYAQRAPSDSDSNNPIRFVATTEGQKADGINLRMSRVDLERYESNPIVLYAHNPAGRDNLPIGKATRTTVEDGALLADIEFDRNDDFAAQVEDKIRNGFLNAVSVGFAFDEIDSDGSPRNWELFEISVVPIPMDPEATAQERADELESGHGSDTAPRAIDFRKRRQAIHERVSYGDPTPVSS